MFWRFGIKNITANSNNLLIIAGFTPSLILFRQQLMKEFLKLGFKVITCAPQKDKETIKKLESMGIQFIQTNMVATGINPIHDILYLFKLIRIIKNLQPEIVFAYTIKAVIYGMIAAGFQGSASRFALITGLGYTFDNITIKQKLVGILGQNLYRFALKKATVVFFQNPDDQNFFRQKRIIQKDRSIILNGSGVDLDYFKMKPIPSGKLIFLLIARLIKDKGIFEYANAAQILKNKYPEVEFHLLGFLYESPNGISKNQIQLWHNQGIINYQGETVDVRPYIKKCSVYVLPSYREGTPRSVLEAMAMGRPIITTDTPGCRETVIEGENGFLVKPKDVNSLVEAMEKFILDPGLIPKMGKRSREIAEEKYDVHKVNKIILEAMGLQNSKDAVSV